MNYSEASPFNERISMKKTSTPILMALLAGLLLSACNKPPESVAPRSQLAAEAVLLKRNLDPAQAARGRVVYDKHCAECHGVNGKGQPGDWRVRDADGNYPPPPLDDSAHAWHHPTEALLDSVREGSPLGTGNMPAWKDELSEQEIQDVVVYIKSLWSERSYLFWLDIEREALEPIEPLKS